MLRFATLAAVLATVSLPLSAHAADLCKSGTTLTIVRISTIKPTGTRAGFDKAMQDQIQWYRGHGITTNAIYEADVLTDASGTPAVSATEVMTMHENPPAVGPNPPAPDAAYQAFVAEFRANSDIATEKYVCLPVTK